MHMKTAVESLLVWTALDIAVGIPLWMLIKLRDRRESLVVSATGLRNVTYSRSSRRPLKNGCRTLPSADFARYSISASNEGSTQMPR
jgi:hypothetical protein